MSTLVDQAHAEADRYDYFGSKHTADLLRQLADRVQELEGKGEPVAWRHWHGEENGGWEYYEEASCADCQPLYTYLPSSVQPEKEERRPLSDEMVLRAARELCKIHAGECQVNEQDTWNIYADQFKRDARAALEAAHGISPSPSMVGREGDGK